MTGCHGKLLNILLGLVLYHFGNLIFVFLPPNVLVAFRGQVFVMWYELVISKSLIVKDKVTHPLQY